MKQFYLWSVLYASLTTVGCIEEALGTNDSSSSGDEEYSSEEYSSSSVINYSDYTLQAGDTLSETDVEYVIKKAAVVDGNLTIGKGVKVTFEGALDITNGTLAIMPGAILCFTQDAYIEIEENAKLIARGTADSSITFKNKNEAIHWGYKWNQNGGIILKDKAIPASVIEHATFQYAKSAINIFRENSVTLKNIRFENSKKQGIYMGVQNALTSLDSSQFINSGEYDIVSMGNDILALGPRLNLSKGIFVPNNTYITEEGTVQGYDYFVEGLLEVGNSTSASDVKITVMAGATFSFAQDAYIKFDQNGRIDALGTDSNAIVFKNTHEGQHWGYKWNNNGGLIFAPKAGVHSSLRHVQILNPKAGISMQREESVHLRHVQIRNAASFGIIMDNDYKIPLGIDYVSIGNRGAASVSAPIGALVYIGSNNVFPEGIEVQTNSYLKESGIIPSYNYHMNGTADIANSDANATFEVTIEPGASFQFLEDGFLSIGASARVLAEGSIDNPILFKNAQDGKRFGYKWGFYGIQIERAASGGSIFDNVVVEGAKTGFFIATEDEIIISNSSIDYDATNAEAMYGIEILSEHHKVTTENLSFPNSNEDKNIFVQ